MQNNGKTPLNPNPQPCDRVISFAYLPDDILGKWWSPDKDGQVEFYKHGGKYYGRLIWSIDDKVGKPKLDDQNPVVSMRNRRIVGADVFKDLVYQEGKYDLGVAYDARSGYTYSCTIWLEGKDVMKCRGYLGFSLLGKTVTMTRIK
ncbi:MAG: DUF2147 domain-containing protein [Bacteroidia bacterium]|nr:DUF2147 domain-containing protein [Bacteroidia bacterium]